MDQHALELSTTTTSILSTNSLSLENQVNTHRAFLRAPPTVQQLAHRHRGARLLCAFMVIAALSLQTCEFTPQVIDSTRGWSDALAERITHTDLLAMVAAVNVCVNMHCTLGQRYLYSLPQLLEAFAAQLSRSSPCAAAALQDEHFIPIVHQEFSLLQQPGYELTILTPTEGIEI